MKTRIEQVIGDDLKDELEQEFQEEIECGATYDDIEELLLGYGLEMDYVEQLLM